MVKPLGGNAIRQVSSDSFKKLAASQMCSKFHYIFPFQVSDNLESQKNHGNPGYVSGVLQGL